MTATTRRGHRLASTAILLVFGSGLAAATWAGGDHGFAIALVAFYALAAGIVWLWSGGSGDVAAIMRVGGDERQKGIDLKATAYSGLAAGLFAGCAVIVQTARGEDATEYALICSVAGFAYVVSLVLLRRRS